MIIALLVKEIMKIKKLKIWYKKCSKDKKLKLVLKILI